MESNFIKERSVVREEIIKKNLEADKRKKLPNSNASTSKSLTGSPPEGLIVFEEIVNEGLRQELVEISKQVDVICQTIADYLKVKSAIKILKANSKDVRIQTNIGCNFYVQCHVDDASMVYICLGKDYYMHMNLNEALKMLDFKEKQWTKILDQLQEKSSRIKAYIKIALETMGRIYEVDRDKLSETNE